MIENITTVEEYHTSLTELHTLLEEDDALGRKIETLSKIIGDYEAINFPIALPKIHEALDFRLEQQNLKTSVLYPILGGKKATKLIMAGKKPITSRKVILALHKKLEIPLSVLLQSTKEDNDKKTAA